MNFQEKSCISLDSNGFHRVVYSDWGPADGNIVVCAHGLTGNGHDFDELAPALAEAGCRVIAPDLPGRGRSDFLANPPDYNYRQYCRDLSALLAHLGVDEPRSIDWIGVSLGGLLGIRLAGVGNSPIRRLILNDVGPEVPKDALDFIHTVISRTYSFATIQALEERMRATRGLSWGPVTDEQWHHMAEHNARALEDGSITYGYDPDIAIVFEDEPTGELDLWPFWDRIQGPVLLLQGAQSPVLPAAIIDKMRGRGPKFDLHVFRDCGHVPSLMAPGQIKVIRKWLAGH